MARYIVKTRIVYSVGADGPDYQHLYSVYDDPSALSIISEYFTSGQAFLIEDSIQQPNTSSKDVINTCSHSFDSEETFLELKQRLNELGDYYSPNVKVEIISKGYVG